MATITYNYSYYKFGTDFNTPLTEAEYLAIKTNKKSFWRNVKKDLQQRFRNDQGTWRVICFFIMAAYFVAGLGIPILSIALPSSLTFFDCSDLFFSIIGVLMVLGFFSLSAGLGYFKSLRSFNKYLRRIHEYYESHAHDISQSSSYKDYCDSRDIGQRIKRANA
jgi:hypothetical protein